MELFVAIFSDRDLALSLSRIALRVSSQYAEATPELPDDLHLTLRYLGETEACDDIMTRLAAVEFSPFEICVSGYGTFTNAGESLFWAGIGGSADALHALKLAVDQALAPNHNGEDHPYVPHITLAYAGRDIRFDLSGLPEPPNAGRLVDRFHLCRVLPDASSNRFERVKTFYLDKKTTHKTVRVLCVNDFHAAIFERDGGVGGAKLVAAIKRYVARHPDTVVVFGGDNYFGDPVSELFGGLPVTHMMRSVGAVASAVGNHEFDFGVMQIQDWQTEGDYAFLSANMLEKSTERIPSFVRPYLMVQCGGIQIALIGLSTPEELGSADRPPEMKDYMVTSGSVAHEWVRWLKSGKDPRGVPDVIIALTHFGLRQTKDGTVVGREMRELCKLPGLDGAFAAHWHQFMKVHIHGVPVAQGGSSGRGFALLTVCLAEDGGVIEVVPDYVDLTQEGELPPDEGTAKMIDGCFQRAQDTLGEVVAVAKADVLHRDPATRSINPAGTPLTLLATRLMREAAPCEIALFYSGRMGDGFSKGPITLYAYYKTVMFVSAVVTMRLRGCDILRNLEVGACTLGQEGASPLAVDGLTFIADYTRPYGCRVRNVTLSDGRPLSPEQYYTVATEEYLAENPLGYDFSNGEDRAYLTSSVQGLMLEHLRRAKILDGEAPDNITVIS